ncbi:MAG: hypothetical protein ACM3H7_06435, partial [Acidobacteriaceae bacterium]
RRVIFIADTTLLQQLSNRLTGLFASSPTLQPRHQDFHHLPQLQGRATGEQASQAVRKLLQ